MSAPDAARRRQERQLARRLHPDRGGDVAEYLAALAALRDPPASVVTVRRTRRPGFGRGFGRGSGRRLRAPLPRWVPGARRLIQL